MEPPPSRQQGPDSLNDGCPRFSRLRPGPRNLSRPPRRAVGATDLCTASRLERAAKTVPQRLKPSRSAYFTARLKPSPSSDGLFPRFLGSVEALRVDDSAIPDGRSLRVIPPQPLPSFARDPVQIPHHTAITHR